MKNKYINKIGILNFHYSNHNYGAVLQAFALQEVLTSLNYVSENIDYCPLVVKKNMPLLKRLRTCMGVLLRSVKLLPPLQKKIVPIETCNFENFRRNYLSIGGRKFHHREELEKKYLNYSAVIVGSDQVWRPIYTKQHYLVYFLSFLPKSIKRVSYAASFGVSRWESCTEEVKNEIKTEMSKFHAISVRESSGVKICMDTFGVKAEHVLDPTLLVDKKAYSKIINDRSVDVTVSDLVYYVLDETDAYVSEINKTAKALNYSVENIYYKKSDNNTIFFNTVPDFLYKLSQSKLIITDSFHCVCFAIIFKKKFIYLANKKRGVARVESLLQVLELKGYILGSIYEKNMLEVANSKLDFIQLDKKIVVLKANSLQFIKSALN